MEITEEKNDYQNLKDFFWEANRAFMEKNYVLLDEDISERCLCGALMYELNKQLEKKNLKKYYADIEFNRDEGNVKRISYKTDDGVYSKRIFTDIIVHSRGEVGLDNLIALEMKKSSARAAAKERDKNRLSLLTSLHSYKYKLGVYYEINHKKQQILIELYQNGKMVEVKTLDY